MEPNTINITSNAPEPVTNPVDPVVESTVEQTPKESFSLSEILDGNKEPDVTPPSEVDEDEIPAKETPAKQTLVEKTQEEDKRVKRDYANLDPEDAKILHLVPNKAYDLLRVRLPKLYEAARKVDELQKQIIEKDGLLTGKQIPQSWHEHPQAFTLSPEYREISKTFNTATYERDFWQQQLINIKSGRPWQVLESYDRNGNPVLGQPKDPSPQDEVAIMGAYQDAERIINDLGTKAQALQSKFKSSYDDASGFIKQVSDKQFNMLLPELQPKKEHLDTFIKAMPQVYANHPITDLASKLYSVVINQALMLKASRENATKSGAIKQDAKRGGNNPKTSISTGKTRGSDSGEINFDDIRTELET